ncbi:MAG: hypothetical protein MZV64_67865 [Ignavibacteriales bacterium]|nr:hypothetical protein [Ignavibacteriales bacterium]
MPAFARKYSMSCKTCHAPFPKLKPYGEEFAGNGFVIKDKDTPRYTIDTGDSAAVPPPRAAHRPAPRGLPGLQQRQRPPGSISSRPTS